MILFVSDLHLAADANIPRWVDFLQGRATQADALYILGDLFEAWIGDDDPEPAYLPIKQAMRELSATVPIYFIHGNRDFLIGQRFARETRCQLLADFTVIDLYGTKTLLSHGDALCIHDTGHQKLRRFTLSPFWQFILRHLPLSIRHRIARKLRQQSRKYTAQKLPAWMDVAPGEVARVLREHGAQRLIHGHTHKPGVHLFELDGQTAERIVLGAWEAQGSVLACHEKTCQLETL
jgi:UDP-2,3-diacylglucosamine hydrolase